MNKYAKENSRVTVKFIDNTSEELLFELKDRNWMNIGELFTDHIVNSMIENELKNCVKPDEVMVIAVGIFKKQ